MTLQIIASVAIIAAAVFVIIATIEIIRKQFFLSFVYNTISQWLVVVVVVVLHYFMK